MRLFLSFALFVVGAALSETAVSTETPTMEAVCALRVTNPLPVGAAPQGRPAGFRLYRAYPGLPYEILAAASCGVFPYKYELEQAPAGMTVTSNCAAIPCQDGLIRWPSPSPGTAVQPTLKVTDSAGAVVRVTWPIRVTTEGFSFVALNGVDSAAGTLDAPYRTFKRAADTGAPTTIVYFRGGVHSVTTGFAVDGGGGPGGINIYNRPSQLLGYPGEDAILDFGGTGHFRMGNATKYVHGLTVRNGRTFAFHLNSTNEEAQGGVFTAVDCQTITGSGQGDNAGCIATEGSSDGARRYNWVMRGLNCSGNTLAVCVKAYFSNATAVLDTRCSSMNGSCIEMKESNEAYTVRGTVCGPGVLDDCFGGNHADNEQQQGHYGEFAFNLALNHGETPGRFAVDMASHARSTGRTVYYRNTFMGLVFIRGLAANDGPFEFRENVIINDQQRNAQAGYTFNSTPALSRLLDRDNLKGTSGQGIVDPQTGALKGKWLTQFGPGSPTPRGHLFRPIGR